MKTLLRLVVFSFIIIGAYTLFATEYVPQGAVDRSGGEASLDEDTPAAVRTARDLVDLGRKVFNGKGSCTLCHNRRGRAPLLDGVGIRASKRIREEGYRGKARTAEGYIIESMREPSAYVVEGFGVPDGSGGVRSPMPVVTGPVIGLTDLEVRAVAAYLEDLSGLEVTVKPHLKEGAD